MYRGVLHQYSGCREQQHEHLLTCVLLREICEKSSGITFTIPPVDMRAEQQSKTQTDVCRQLRKGDLLSLHPCVTSGSESNFPAGADMYNTQKPKPNKRANRKTVIRIDRK